MITAKELDNETSYTYFGARYYDSELSGWLSVDPMSDKYPSLSPYCYTADNPVVLVDPNGMWIDEFNLDTNTGEITKISNKGGDKIDYYNIGTTNEKGELSESKYNYNIKQGLESQYKPDGYNQTIITEWQTNEIFYQGGGEIEWNIYGEDVCVQSENHRGFDFDKRSDIELLHELAHAWDNMAGLYADKSMTFNGFNVVDLTALRTENIIRKEMGLPLRMTETYNIFDGVKYPSYNKIIESNGNFIFDKYQH